MSETPRQAYERMLKEYELGRDGFVRELLVQLKRAVEASEKPQESGDKWIVKVRCRHDDSNAEVARGPFPTEFRALQWALNLYGDTFYSFEAVELLGTSK